MMNQNNEERRADERHRALMDMVKMAKENCVEAVAALKKAAEEAKARPKTLSDS